MDRHSWIFIGTFPIIFQNGAFFLRLTKSCDFSGIGILADKKRAGVVIDAKKTRTVKVSGLLEAQSSVKVHRCLVENRFPCNK